MRRRVRTGIVLGCLLVLTGTTGTPSFAQSPGAAPGREADTPLLMARGEGDERGAPLEIGTADVHVTIAGFLARTTTTLTFENRTGRTLEGELVFPLPEGATVSGYGLDVEGHIVDAVVVEAQAARLAFEEETRRGIDPGLVEWVRGNSFRTRVWPIPAHGRRTVRVEYVAALARDADRTLIYHLPLRYSLPIPEATLRIEVLDPSARPKLHTSRLANVRFTAWEGRLAASARLRNQSLSDDIRVSIPPVEHQSAVVETYKDGRAYFAIEDMVEFAAPPPAAKPRRVGLLWDASLSHSDADVRRELDVIEAWLALLEDVEIVLTVFRNVAEPPQTLTIRRGDAAPVLAALRREPRDGGTSFQTLRPSSGVAYYLLVSDGFTNIGGGLPQGLGAPIYTLTGSARADHSLLRLLARSSGGQYIPMSRLTSDEAAARIGRPPTATVWVEYDRTALADVLPAAPEPIDGRVTVTGRLLASEAAITLRYVAASGATTERRFRLRRTEGAASGLVPRFWAERKAAELSLASDRHRPELVALGKQFGIVTPGTSLLVLETLDQYVRHRIEPPESRAELRTEYLKHAAERTEQEPRTRKDKLDRVLTMWAERIAWWKSEPKAPMPQQPTADAPQPSTGGAPRARDTRTAPLIDCGSAPSALQGLVRDVNDTAIPGATVTATNTATGTAVSVATNENGQYRVCNVPPGAYAIRVELTGFRTWGREVRLPTTRALNVTLEIGALAETVTVAAEAMPFGTASAGVPGSIDETPFGTPPIEIKAWNPETPYLTAMKKAGPANAYSAYLTERQHYATSPSFFLDCAEYFLASGDKATGLRVLTSILDLKFEDPRLLRIVAHRLQQIGERDLAIEMFEQILRLRAEEPQSLRDLALALADRGDDARSSGGGAAEITADYLRSLELLDQIVLGEWDDRFPEIEIVALIDANRLLSVMERENLPGIERVTLDHRLRHSFDLDVRIVLTWDTDLTDMDLWVTEPTGEKCYYSNSRTSIGAMISRDFTNGYGPEEYLLRRAVGGRYTVQANFYGSRSQALTGPTTAQATVITNFGRPGERRRTLTLRLSDAKEVVDIGSVLFETGEKKP